MLAADYVFLRDECNTIHSWLEASFVEEMHLPYTALCGIDILFGRDYSHKLLYFTFKVSDYDLAT